MFAVLECVNKITLLFDTQVSCDPIMQCSAFNDTPRQMFCEESLVLSDSSEEPVTFSVGWEDMVQLKILDLYFRKFAYHASEEKFADNENEKK